jgi:hypothetical protein
VFETQAERSRKEKFGRGAVTNMGGKEPPLSCLTTPCTSSPENDAKPDTSHHRKRQLDRDAFSQNFTPSHRDSADRNAHGSAPP